MWWWFKKKEDFAIKVMDTSSAVKKLLPFKVEPMDSFYDLHFIDHKFLSKLLSKYKYYIRGHKYTKDSFDCDDYALHLHSRAKLLASELGIKAGLPFGSISYTQDRGGKHRINFYIKDCKTVFIEPQSGLVEKVLSRKEIKSIYRPII